jgi:hypothetical protein
MRLKLSRLAGVRQAHFCASQGVVADWSDRAQAFSNPIVGSVVCNGGASESGKGAAMAGEMMLMPCPPIVTRTEILWRASVRMMTKAPPEMTLHGEGADGCHTRETFRLKNLGCLHSSSFSRPRSRVFLARVQAALSSVASRSLGKRAEKTLPLPGWEAIDRRPPWRASTCLTIARPRPVPPEAVERLLSTR